MADKMAYIARCRCGCGSVVFATMDEPEFAKHTAKSIAKMIRDGYSIERVSLNSFRMAHCSRQSALV